MRIGSFFYLVGQGIRNLWKNRLMSIASIGVLISCMLLIGAAVLASVNINNMVGYLEDQSEAVVFLDDGLTDDQIEEVRKAILQSGNIVTINFVSKEDALKEMMESIGDDGVLFEAYSEDDSNNLPDTFRVTLDDVSKLSETVVYLQNLEGVDSVSAPTEVAKTITGLKKIVAVGGLVVVAILVTVSLMIIGNTIKITVFSRRKEINIMKYVGATDAFIRLPFFVEGVLLGLISAAAAYGLLYFGYDYLARWIEGNQNDWLAMIVTNLVPFSTVAMDLLKGFLIGGVGIGVAGGALFLTKHLKV
ncbi:MAG TPA: permease-like cell division protein FtsX [Oscillospiraceae bacterium]|nr:permease-like cell division protein FtsX [Oscillospiraceae bacterium]HXK78034.1 permease-like cell division protein FtsX [Oscillospiraceae bacterium]